MDYISLFVIPLTLFNFCLEFLPDKEVTRDELKIGILNLIHHLFYAFNILGVSLLLFLQNPSFIIIILTVISSIITQVGYLLHNDFCWITRMVNTLINPDKPNRKWRAGVESMIKHYLRGDEWAYSEIKNVNNDNLLIFMNIVHLILLIKYYIKL